MDCKEFRELLDLFVDGELSPEAARAACVHARECAACARAEGQLLRLRRSLKRAVLKHRPPAELESSVRGLTLRHTPAATPRSAEAPAERGVAPAKLPFWRVRVSLPAPVFALLLLASVGFAAWGLLVRRTDATRTEGPSGRSLRTAATVPPTVTRGEPDLSRFYTGERASIQVVSRTSLGGALR